MKTKQKKILKNKQQETITQAKKNKRLGLPVWYGQPQVRTANDLLNWLLELRETNDLKRVLLNHRESDNDDVTEVTSFGEDLYDSKTNSILESICFYGED